MKLPIQIPAKLPLLALASIVALSLTACQVQGTGNTRSAQPAAPGLGALAPDLAVSLPPHDAVEVNWKQRLAESYVYTEARGSYTGVGALLEETYRQVQAAGLKPSGPPFALFYDDPGVTPVEALRMRACFPVEGLPTVEAPLVTASLPSTTVVYAFVGGPYPDVPRAYPSLFGFLDELGWALDGPIREIYLVNPAAVEDWNQLVAEVQLPATSGR